MGTMDVALSRIPDRWRKTSGATLQAVLNLSSALVSRGFFTPAARYPRGKGIGAPADNRHREA